MLLAGGRNATVPFLLKNLEDEIFSRFSRVDRLLIIKYYYLAQVFMTKPLSDHLDAFREKRLVEQEQERERIRIQEEIEKQIAEEEEKKREIEEENRNEVDAANKLNKTADSSQALLYSREKSPFRETSNRPKSILKNSSIKMVSPI